MYSVDDLRTFLAIVETQGVTSGARRVGISAATASHRLSKLEAALNLTLLHRNSRTVRMTDAGQIFFDRTQVIIADLAQAEHDAGSGTSELTGNLRVTMSPWILSRFLLPALRTFQRSHPNLIFDFLTVDRFVPLTAEGQDCAIRVGQMADSSMVARKLCDNHRIICASPDFLAHHGVPDTITDLLDTPWVCLPWQRRLALCDAKGRKRDVTVGSRVLVSNSDMLTDGAVQGVGLAVKSRLAIKTELDTGQLVEVFPGKLWEPDAPIWFVVPPESRSAHKTRVFGAMVRTVFRGMGGAA